MGTQNLSSASTTDLANGVTNYSLSGRALDYAEGGNEEYWYFSEAKKNFAYYKDDAALKSGIDTLANYVTGRGWKALSGEQQALLELIKGWGEDSFDSIMWNLIVVKKIVGDAFAEIIRADNNDPKSKLINLKPISPERVRLVLEKNGMIKRYDVLVEGVWKPLQRERMLHLCNGRIGDEIHGTSVVEACKWIIDARNECMKDWRRISHRSSLRVLYVDVFNTAKLTELKTQYKDGIENGEVLILPGRIGEIGFEDLKLPDVNAFLNWIQYLENFFYQVLGVPKAIMGGTIAVSEGNSKVGILSWEQVYRTEQRLLEQDIWSQLNLKIEFEAPTSMMGNMMMNEAKNTSQTGFQPKDAKITGGRE